MHYLLSEPDPGGAAGMLCRDVGSAAGRGTAAAVAVAADTPAVVDIASGLAADSDTDASRFQRMLSSPLAAAMTAGPGAFGVTE